MTEPMAALKKGYYLLNTDGGNAGDRLGQAGIGVVLRTPGLVTLAEISKAIGPATHNVAEYQALIAGLMLARDHGIEQIRVYMDSELVIEQVNGFAEVKEAHLVELHREAIRLRALFKSIRFCWVPREMNAEADRLASAALLDTPDNASGPEPSAFLEAPDNAAPEQQPKAKKAKKQAEWKSWPDAEKAEHLLAHQVISDRSWTDEPRLEGEKRDAFIRRILLGDESGNQTASG